MPVDFQVDSLDSVDESLRSAYVETDGKFTLDADKYAEVRAQGLKNKNKELLGKLTKANDGLKKFEKFAEFDDSDLDELLELRANKESLNDKGKDQTTADAERLAHLEKQHKKALDKVSSEKTAAETRAAELEKELKHFKLTVPIREAAAKAGVLAEDMEVVLLDTQKRFQLNEEGKIVVLDEDGDQTDITVQKFFESLYKEQRPKFYAASGASGSGAPTNTKTSSGKEVMRRADHDKLTLSNPQAAIAFAKKVSEGKAALVD